MLARHRLHHRHGPLGQAFRFGVVAQIVVQARQGVQDVGDIGMVRADGAFKEGERLPAEREGFLEPPLGPSRDGQIVEADGFVQGSVLAPLRPASWDSCGGEGASSGGCGTVECSRSTVDTPKRRSDRSLAPHPPARTREGEEAHLTALGKSRHAEA